MVTGDVNGKWSTTFWKMVELRTMAVLERTSERIVWCLLILELATLMLYEIQFPSEVSKDIWRGWLKNLQKFFLGAWSAEKKVVWFVVVSVWWENQRLLDTFCTTAGGVLWICEYLGLQIIVRFHRSCVEILEFSTMDKILVVAALYKFCHYELVMYGNL